MSIYEQVVVDCRSCAQSQIIDVAVSLDGAAQPWVRESILDRSFHRFTCNSCGASITADTEFLYTDYIESQRYFYSVKRHKKGYEFRTAGKELDQELITRVPAKYSKEVHKPAKRLRRVVFGLDELREKLVAADAGLKDTHVELAKLKILREHPVLLSKPRLRLRMERASPQGVEYVARFDHSNDRYRINVPWDEFSRMAPADGSNVNNWLNTLPQQVNPAAVFDDGFVNVERLSPQNAALARLQHYVDEIDAGGVPDFVGPPTLEATLQSLPLPEHLPNWAMTAIRQVIAYADSHQLGGAIEDLFKAAFNFRPEREWGDNAIFGDAENLFLLLENLPDEHVQGNTRLDRIEITLAGTWYDVDSDVIGIQKDKITSKQLLKDYLYHEVGHSVHSFYDERENNLVTRWLGDEVGFLYFGDYYGMRSPDDIEINTWVAMMGGYNGLDDYERTQCREVIKEILNPYLVDDNNNYIKTRPPLPDTVVVGHPFNNANFGPRRTYDESPDKWWLNAKKWHQSEFEGDRWAFAFNYTYKHLMAVRVTAIDLHLSLLKYRPEDIDGAYAYNSPWEFFAEIYRVYYDPDIGPGRLDAETRGRLYGMLGEPEQTILG